MADSWREECAVMAVWGDDEAARMAYLGLYAQQHRGQESAGIVSLEGTGDSAVHHSHRGLGLVGEVFGEADLDRLRGRAAIGHCRYSTTGLNVLSNSQPLMAHLKTGPIAIAHNGNLVNAETERLALQRAGAIFQGTSDTEIILHLIARAPTVPIEESLALVMQQMVGAFSLVALTHKNLIAIRDSLGFRPLVLGERTLEGGRVSYVVASETCAFDLIGARYVRDIAPGEMIWIDSSGLHSRQWAESPGRTAHCVFEHVYFARPDSLVFGRSVYESRKKMGRILARECPVEADIVIPVPDSGVPAALGYSAESGIPFEFGIIRNHYIGRTFIQPSQSIRSFGVKIKHNPQNEILRGQRVIVIDDSLVRGTTSQKLIRLIRSAGAKEVHLRIASPPTTGPCYYGVDTPERANLIAASQSVEEIREFIDADSLSYLSMEGLLSAVRGEANQFCAACFDGRYPTAMA